MEKLKQIDQAIDYQNWARIYSRAAQEWANIDGEQKRAINYQIASADLAAEARKTLLELINK